MMIYGQKDRSVFREILTIRVGVARKVRWCSKSRATRLYNPLCRSVCRSVRHTILFLFFPLFVLTIPAQMMKWPQIWPLPTRTRLG